jgi:hypothetical protein
MPYTKVATHRPFILKCEHQSILYGDTFLPFFNLKNNNTGSKVKNQGFFFLSFHFCHLGGPAIIQKGDEPNLARGQTGK